MRIISGKFKGHHIPAPKGMKARPTTDFAKTALFNILENKFDFENMAVLDLFCGTGSIGFEFISRGAASVIAVDNDFQAAKFCNAFAQTLGIATRYKAYKNDCLRALKQLNQAVDMVFCDPPYSWPNHGKLAETILKSEALKAGGWLIVEHGAKTEMKAEPFFVETRKYGNVLFSFFQKKTHA